MTAHNVLPGVDDGKPVKANAGFRLQPLTKLRQLRTRFVDGEQVDLGTDRAAQRGARRSPVAVVSAEEGDQIIGRVNPVRLELRTDLVLG